LLRNAAERVDAFEARNVALPAKSDSGVSHRRIPAEGEGKILKFRASFSEDQRDIDLGGRV
jgi:hypothetical protein